MIKAVRRNPYFLDAASGFKEGSGEKKSAFWEERRAFDGVPNSDLKSKYGLESKPSIFNWGEKGEKKGQGELGEIQRGL